MNLLRYYISIGFINKIHIYNKSELLLSRKSKLKILKIAIFKLFIEVSIAIIELEIMVHVHVFFIREITHTRMKN